MDRDMRMRDRAMRRDMRSRDSRGRYTRDRGYHHEMMRGMDYGMGSDYRNRDYAEYDMRQDYNYGQDGARGRRDYESSRQSDMGSHRSYMSDGHYGSEGKTYYPIEAMGAFTGYYGMPEDYGRGRGRDYNYDYGRGRDYNMDYGRDYGENKLEKHELEKWAEKLQGELGTDEKEIFKMDKVVRRATDMGIKFEDFSEHELYVATLMAYTDYKDAIGKNNLDMSIKLAKLWLLDKDSGLKYGEKLASYYDNVIEA